MNHMEYKGYFGSAEVDVQGRALVGKLLFIRDTITYSAQDPDGLLAAFHEAVDDYLATCEELGDEPDQPCKGTFNVRVGPSRHLAAAIEARKRGTTLNDFICLALDAALAGKHEHTHNHFGQVTVQMVSTDGSVVASLAGSEQRSTSRAITTH